MPTRRRLLAAAFTAGAAVLVALVLRFETARHEVTGKASSCAINETLDCDRVQSSSWSKVLGVSLSAWGAAGNLVLLLWLLGAPRSPTLFRAAGALALLNLLAGLFYAYVSWFVIGALCLYCTAMQVLGLVLAVLVVPPALRARDPGPRAAPLLRGAVAAFAVLGLAAAGDAYATDRAQLLRLFERPPDAAIRVDVADSLLLGDPATPLSVLLYVDFGCPRCRACYHMALDLLKKHPRDVHFLFKHWPLDRECNAELRDTAKPGTCLAARAAQAAALRGGDGKALKYLFGLNSFFPALLADLGRLIGVPEAEWKELLHSRRVADLVARDVAEGNALNLAGVPGVFINGHPTDPARLAPRVERLVGR
jgi:uncharacterized membrane protein/predicted DsbA family dithiol-disulfide isomerase